MKAAPPGNVERFAIRIASVSIGVAAVVFGLLALPGFIETHLDDRVVNGWVAFGLVMVSPLILAAITLLLSPLKIRALWGAYAILYALILGLWVLQGTQHSSPYGEVWITSIVAIPAAAAMLARPQKSAWIYLGIISILTILVTFRSSNSDARLLESIQTGVFAFAFSAIFVGCTQVALRATARLDAEIEAESRAASESLAAEARERERMRVESLIHDGVISTLLVASTSEGTTAELASQAQLSLQQLSEGTRDGRYDENEILARFRRLIETSRVSTTLQIETVAGASVDANVVDALLGATAEALRNVAEHAGALTSRGEPVKATVTLNVGSESVSVVVSDNGVGFDVNQIAPDRMGIQRSIKARMQEVQGGFALVESVPGEGTRVTLNWISS